MAEKKKVEGKKQKKGKSDSKSKKRARHLGEHRADKRHIKNVLLSSGLEAAIAYEKANTHVHGYAAECQRKLLAGRKGARAVAR